MTHSQLAILGGFLAMSGLVFLRIVAIGRHSALLRREIEKVEKAVLAARRRLLEEKSAAAGAREISDVELVDPGENRG